MVQIREYLFLMHAAGELGEMRGPTLVGMGGLLLCAAVRSRFLLATIAESGSEQPYRSLSALDRNPH